MEKDGATCPYCTHKQQKTNKEEESQILENFQERYYKHKHQGSPIVTRVQFDPRLTQGANKSSDSSQTGFLSEEDKELEQRFNILRQDRTKEAPSLAELQDQFDKFQGKESTQDTSNDTSGSGQTSETKSEFEQTQALIQQMKEEAELESKLESHGKKQEEDLAARFNALQGKQDPLSQSSVPPSESQNINISTNQAIEDPQQLLNDLKGMAAQEEESALQELESSDVQSLVQNFKPDTASSNDTTTNTGDAPNITYPPLLEDVTPSKPKPQVSEEELKRLIAQAKAENEREAQAKARDDEFYLHTSKKVSSLMADSDSDSDGEVKSKPKKGTTSHREQKQHGLEFIWNHFESTASGMHTRDNNWDFDDDEEFDQQVQSLIEEMSAEVKLEESLEAHGMGHIIDDKPPPPIATATTNPISNPTTLPSTGPSAAIGSEDELPWCCMCNSNATVRCFDCDDDLYCVPCFSQCHERFGLFDHQYAPYEPTYKS